MRLPDDARGEAVCIRWSQDSKNASGLYDGCWAMENVIITSLAHKETFLEEDFDPVDPGDWLFFPSGTVKMVCCSMFSLDDRFFCCHYFLDGTFLNKSVTTCMKCLKFWWTCDQSKLQMVLVNAS